MAVDPREFLAAAERLCESEAEIDARNAISRAYYAAHHIAKNATFEKLHTGHLEQAKTSHEQVIMCFVNSPEVAHKSIGYTLRDMKKHRHEADYMLHLPSVVLQTDALQMVARTKILLQRIDGLAASGSADEAQTA